MKGLILKDLYILKGTISTTLTILGILLLYCFIKKYSVGLVIIPSLIIAATTTSSLKLDWSIGWDKIALTMPVNKRDVVRSKYFELLILCIAGMIVGIGCAVIQNLFFESLDIAVIFNFALLSLSMSIIGGGFHILLAYRLGGTNLENSEILLFLAYGISMAIIGGFMFCIHHIYPINLTQFSISLIIIVVFSMIIFLFTYSRTSALFDKKEL